MTKIECIRTFLLEHLGAVDSSVCSRLSTNGNGVPEFDLCAYDYLEFADQELKRFTTNSAKNRDAHALINCVSHLKRAVDCQLDTFLYAYNIYAIFQKRNLKFEKKLEFIGECGVFNSISLARLNTARNRMEHHYEIPKIEDIEVYFDLVTAFVSVLERTAKLISVSCLEFTFNRNKRFEGLFEIDYSNLNKNFKKSYDFLRIDYSPETPEIIISWQVGEDKEELEATLDQPYEFAYFFRVFMVLVEYGFDAQTSPYARKMLGLAPNAEKVL